MDRSKPNARENLDGNTASGFSSTILIIVHHPAVVRAPPAAPRSSKGTTSHGRNRYKEGGLVLAAGRGHDADPDARAIGCRLRDGLNRRPASRPEWAPICCPLIRWHATASERKSTEPGDVQTARVASLGFYGVIGFNGLVDS